MKLIEDLGMIFHTENSKNKARYGIYECPICNKHFKTRTGNVKSGKSTKCKSCAISIKNKTHGDTGSRLHRIWIKMKDRCYNKNHVHYKYYGGKGVIIHGLFGEYQDFKNWAELNGYKDGLTIDRVDSNGNYEPNNCRWVTLEENVRKSSKRSNYKNNKSIKISEDMASEICEAYATGLFTQTDIAKGLKVSQPTISDILIHSGMRKRFMR